MRLLIAENDEHVATAIGMVYERRGHRVDQLFEWMTGEPRTPEGERLATLQRQRYKLVLLDMEWCGKRRPVHAALMLETLVRYWWPNAYVAGYSERTDAVDEADGYRLNHMLAKPVDVDELLGLVELARRHHARLDY